MPSGPDNLSHLAFIPKASEKILEKKMTSTNDFVSQVSSRAKRKVMSTFSLCSMFVRRCRTCTKIPHQSTEILRLNFKSVKMAMHWVTLVLAFGTQCSTGSRELIFLGQKTGATPSGLTLSLKVPFRILFKISNGWLNLPLHPTFRPREAGPAAPLGCAPRQARL